MEALILTVFISVVLSAAAVLVFVWDVRQGSHDHHDRLSLLPLDATTNAPKTTTAAAAATTTPDKGEEA